MKHGFRLLLTALVLVGVGQARADFFVNATGLDNPTTTITFSEVSLPAGTQLNSQYDAYGVNFDAQLFAAPGDPATPTPGIDGDHAVLTPGREVNTFTILFNDAQTAAAVALAPSQNVALTVQAFYQGSSVTAQESITMTSDNPFLVLTGLQFDEITISGPSTLVDNIEFGQQQTSVVPAPSGLILLGIAVGVAGLWRRRQVVAA